MFTNCLNRFGYMFNMFANRPLYGCCSSWGSYSEPYIPPINQRLLNSVFGLSSISSRQTPTIPQLPIPTLTASPTIYTPYTNGDVYTFTTPNSKIDHSGLYNLSYYNNMSMPFLGVTKKATVSNDEILEDDEEVEEVEDDEDEEDDEETEEVEETEKAKKAKEAENAKKASEPKKTDKNKKTDKVTKYQGAREFAQMYEELGITDTRFQKIFEECILRNEGRKPGKDNDVIWDVKAYNKNGVLQSTYDMYRDFRNLPRTDISNLTHKEMCDLYYTLFYKACGADKIEDDRLALYVFDCAVNMGENKAKKLLAKSGPDASRFAEEQRSEYRRIAENPEKSNYLNGWLNRVNNTEAYADRNFA